MKLPRKESQHEQLSLPGVNKRGKARPHIAPQWQNTYPDHPPAGAGSHRRVECCGCKDIHEMRDRRMHNGTRSECPRCGDAMFTDAWDDAA